MIVRAAWSGGDEYKPSRTRHRAIGEARGKRAKRRYCVRPAAVTEVHALRSALGWA